MRQARRLPYLFSCAPAGYHQANLPNRLQPPHLEGFPATHDFLEDSFQRLLDWGLVDAFRELHPGTQAFSWWDYRGGAFHRKQGLRIDFLLCTWAVMDRVVSVEIDREYRKKQDGLTASDHAPVLAELS